MIVGFRHKGLKLLFDKGNRRRVSPEHADKVERIFFRFDGVHVCDVDLVDYH